MNDPQLVIKALEQLAKDLKEAPTPAERASLYSAARWLLSDLEAFINEDLNEDGYLLEAVGKALWAFGAMAGYDVNNNLSQSEHCVAALAAIGNISSVLNRS
ncbi:hypothetical protein HA052_23110 [Chromobacterium haemolyticum]|uniref:Uncharacterized protein n=1 Tax=Chromobacterium fluminis TaxID=3044269 RepID=A0ABX0LHZ1_9NEIS|nr:hypothetical protein [Chromobacterium haemolyticum]NHR08085.1 hypothetical protein [Chromobacterium haemolyticum]